MKENLVRAGDNDGDDYDNVSNGELNDDQIMLTMMFFKGQVQIIDFDFFFLFRKVYKFLMLKLLEGFEVVHADPNNHNSGEEKGKF